MYLYGLTASLPVIKAKTFPHPLSSKGPLHQAESRKLSFFFAHEDYMLESFPFNRAGHMQYTLAPLGWDWPVSLTGPQFPHLKNQEHILLILW